MKLGSIQKQLAWQNAFELRGCPPEALLFCNSKAPELAAHIALCGICKEKLESAGDDLSPWVKLAEQLPAKSIHKSPGAIPSPGQIWSLSRRLSGWSPANLHYNAPNVLILEIVKENECLLKVAQTHTAAELMGTGDVWLAKWCGFAETWNTYYICKEDLEFCRGTIEARVLAKVLSTLQQVGERCGKHHESSEYTFNASIVDQFRKLEIEVGSYCAARSSIHADASTGANQTQLPPITADGIRCRTDWKELNEKVRSVAAYWEPDWVGMQATAADAPVQKNTFRLEDGEIHIACYWKSQYGNKPSYIHVRWSADICCGGELWLVFIRPGSESILAEIRLGDRYEGEEAFSSKDLGFDPSCEKWAMSIYLKEKQS